MQDSNDNSKSLTDQLERLNDELRVIRNVLDEIREQLTWGLQNGRVFLSLVAPDERDPYADAEIEGHTIGLAIRLQTSLTTLAQDIAAAVQEQRSPSNELVLTEEAIVHPKPVTTSDSTSHVAPSTRAPPKVKPLFDEVCFNEETLPENTQQPQAEDKLDKCSKSDCSEDEQSITDAHPLKEEQPTTPDFVVKDSVRFEFSGKIHSGEVVSISDEFEAIVKDRNSGDIYHISLDQLSKYAESAADSHESWLTEIRDSANAASEGVRTVSSRYGKAKFEYEIAQLSENRWAIHWQLGFYCGDYTGHGYPWQQFSSREECLGSMLDNVRTFFSKKRDDAPQNRSRLEILKQLNTGICDFQEPPATPANNSQQPATMPS